MVCWRRRFNALLLTLAAFGLLQGCAGDPPQAGVSTAPVSPDVRQQALDAAEAPIQSKQAVRLPAQVPAEQAAAPNAAQLVQRSMAVARLEARTHHDMDAYRNGPRRAFVGARAQEYRFARYLDEWCEKIEWVGSLNYPAEAKANKIYGSVQVTVAIRADGTVERVEINRSSGHEILDQAVIRVVQLAAPFTPFPKEIRRDTDILEITRTWTFTREDAIQPDP